MSAIELDQVRFAYEGKLVLDRLSCTIPEGETTLLLGASGAGKTTLLRLLAGLERPQGGSIRGLPAAGQVSMVFQEDRLIPQLTVEENLRLVLPTLQPAQAGELLEQLALPGVLGQWPGQLSGGMRRRVALARGLIYPAQLYLMDEPCQGLDPGTRAQVLAIIEGRLRGKTLVMISHDPGDAAPLHAHVLSMQQINAVKEGDAV